MADDGESLTSTLPSSLRQLRACLSCHLILTTKQWDNSHYGCPNCQWDGGFKEMTTPVFKGVLAMMQPRASWVARWHKLENRIPGMYAMQVVGKRSQQAER